MIKPCYTGFLGSLIAGLGCLLMATPGLGSEEGPEKLYGVLQGSLAQAEKGYRSGWRVAVLPVSWDAFEPEKDKIDKTYIRQLMEKRKELRALGYKLQLDLGMQYPPSWIFKLPNSRYRNQYGSDYTGADPGKNIPNVVFNRQVRERQCLYMEKVFEQLGADWDWVRLGGGFYGEVNYPQHVFDANRNCYWAFDALAQGKAEGLPEGMKPCPVRGWIPGTVSRDHESARLFLEWYHGSLQHYHNWQISTVRRWYQGDICMMYGSWGIRPGWVEKALSSDLSGSSQVEQGGEIATGYDWTRMIGGIRDSRVIVYCTWLDAPPKDCDDEGKNLECWSPVHWQVSLAEANPLKLRVWGENTGRGEKAAMQVTFERMKRFGLMGVMWAFEEDLFADPNPGKLATFADYAAFIRDNR